MKKIALLIVVAFAVIALAGCVSVDAGVAEVGLRSEKFRFIKDPVGFEADMTAYIHLKIRKGLGALFGWDAKEINEAINEAVISVEESILGIGGGGEGASDGE